MSASESSCITHKNSCSRAYMQAGPQLGSSKRHTRSVNPQNHAQLLEAWRLCAMHRVFSHTRVLVMPLLAPLKVRSTAACQVPCY